MKTYTGRINSTRHGPGGTIKAFFTAGKIAGTILVEGEDQDLVRPSLPIKVTLGRGRPALTGAGDARERKAPAVRGSRPRVRAPPAPTTPYRRCAVCKKRLGKNVLATQRTCSRSCGQTLRRKHPFQRKIIEKVKHQNDDIRVVDLSEQEEVPWYERKEEV